MSVPAGDDKPLCIKKIMQQLPENERQVINILHRMQDEKGYLAQEDLGKLAMLLNRPEAELQGLASFFEHFRTRPLGRNHLSVCYGTACYARGANLVYDRLAGALDLDEYGTSPDGFITLDKVQCVGACSLAPVLIANGNLEGRIKSHQMPQKLKEMRETDAERE